MSEPIRAELSRVAHALGAADAPFVLERPRDEGHGDLATNLALLIAKSRRSNPRSVAEEVVRSFAFTPGLVERVEIAGPGFINFWLGHDQLAASLSTIVRAGDHYGRADFGTGTRVNVEFVSANPTGPLHVGHGRGAALGDGIAALLEWTGHAVTREFYINDAGGQIDKLVESLWARIQQRRGTEAAIPEGGYHGEYLTEAAARAPEVPADFAAAAPTLRRFILQFQREEQDALLADFGVRFEVHSSEQEIYDDGRVAATLAELAARGLSYERDGALWLRSEAHGDDKDRVLRKSDGSLTYLVSDIAYHLDKLERGYDRLIDVWGADHHGYTGRMHAAFEALGEVAGQGELELIIMQFVYLIEHGERASMSKRRGDFVTLDELIALIGVDAARFFMLQRSHDTTVDLDLDLAREQSSENPVYYVQYAHARIASILKKAGAPRVEAALAEAATYGGELHPSERTLVKKLLAFAEEVAEATDRRAPHRIGAYALELAQTFTAFYRDCQVVGAEGEGVESFRLALSVAAQKTIARSLDLLGVSAPEKM